MTTFDGSSAPAPARVHDYQPVAEETAPVVSALDMLRAEVEQRDSQERELLPVEVPGLPVRLMCRTDFSAAEWESWQKLAIPAAKRKSRNLSPTDMQQHVLYSLVLVNTCEHLEYRSGQDWQPITGKDQEPLNLASREMLDRFGQMDAASLVRKLFGRDAALLRAGQRVVNASGYGDEEDGGENPTV